MKKKLLIMMTFVLFVILVGVSYSKASSLMPEIGRLFKNHSNMDQTTNVYAVGKNATVTVEEIEQATEFYKLSGMSEEDARLKAENYMLEYEALYQEAIRSGYSVSDEEIDAYLSELKETMNTAANKKDVEELIAQFDSPEEYWEYQHSVSQKSLPIQKYVAEKKKEFDSEDLWEEYFQQLKQNLVNAEEYTIN